MATRFLYLTGYGFNSLFRAWTNTAAVPSDASTIYPAANLYDAFVENPFVWNTVAANPSIAIDLNGLQNGSMALNSGGNVTLWTEVDTGTGDVTFSAAGGPTGGPAAQFVAGTGIASLFQLYNARPGEQLTLRGSLKGDGTHAMGITVQNQLDGTYLTAGGAWQVAATTCMSQTAASWATPANIVFTMPTFAAQFWPLLGYVPLKVTLACVAAATASFATNVFLWPSTSWLSIHGYDSQPQLALNFNKGGSADTGPSYTLQSALTVQRPAFYYATAAGVLIGDRFLQVTMTGTPTTPPWIGELVIGQYSTLTTPWSFGYKYTRYMDQVRTKATFGGTRTRQIGQLERRIWAGHQQDRSSTDFADFLSSVMRVSGYGRHAIVMAPRDDLSDVIYGQLPPQVDATQSFVNITERDLQVIEDAFPTFVA